MEDTAELHHSNSDEVILFDDKTTGGLGSKESAAMLKNGTIHCLFLSRQTRMANLHIPFWKIPTTGMWCFTILTVTKPFATVKGKGVVEAWQAAVDEMNATVNKTTSRNLFDPPIAIRTVCWRFDNAMKLIKEISAAIPFPSGRDNEELPNSLQSLLEDLYELNVCLKKANKVKKLVQWLKKRKIMRWPRQSKMLPLVISVHHHQTVVSVHNLCCTYRL
jgi:hypothetical protein